MFVPLYVISSKWAMLDPPSKVLGVYNLARLFGPPVIFSSCGVLNHKGYVVNFFSPLIKGVFERLEERLKLYELYTKLGNNVKKMFGKKMIFAPLERKNEVLVFLPDDLITKENMMTFAQNALGKIPKKVFLPEVEVKKVISIEEMISRLTERIEKVLQLNFKDFSGVAKTREEKVIVIVGFLAMLELVRQGILHAIQENDFGDIFIRKNNE